MANAIADQAKIGTHWAAQCELELEVAERLQEMIPSAELVRFSNSATEAVLNAFRLARGHTGRRLILRFEGHYHGWSDEGLIGFANPESSWGPPENPAKSHPSKGVISEIADSVIVARWNDPEHLRQRVDAYRGQIAAIVFEPVLCNTCCIEAADGMMAAIRELCDRDGILMIADETITGFRFGASCAQGYYGFCPDLTILGKAVGGGTPFAALAGTNVAMSKILSGEVVHAGTLNANPLCLSASRWCLDQVVEQGNSHPSRLQFLGNQLMEGLAVLSRKFDVPLRPQGPGLIFHTVVLRPGAREGAITDYRDYVRRHDAARWGHLRRCLLEEGVRAIERGLWSISLSHREGDIAEALARSERGFGRHASTWVRPT
jgi:glutamate-1-semialdehyde 2,1-aminomutase